MISYCPSCGSCLVDQKCPNCIVKPIRADELPDERPEIYYLNEREKMHP